MTSADAAEVRKCFRDAAGAFVDVLAAMSERAAVSEKAAVSEMDWTRPGLGDWTVRDLAGHASRALVTVENYLDPAATAVEPALSGALDYFRDAASGVADADAVAERGRQAGAALGDDPHATVAALAGRVLALVDGSPDDALVTTPAGTIALVGYLPTRTFELTVHTLDLAAATGVAVPAALTDPLRASLHLAAELADERGSTVDVLLALTGRRPLPQGFSVL
jgi:uncharacterized protein (TIGR03083 family)